jgi:hypothetical protein
MARIFHTSVVTICRILPRHEAKNRRLPDIGGRQLGNIVVVKTENNCKLMGNSDSRLGLPYTLLSGSMPAKVTELTG